MNNYYMINVDTKEKFLLVNATRPSFSVRYTKNKGIKTKIGKTKYNPIKYDYAELIENDDITDKAVKE